MEIGTLDMKNNLFVKHKTLRSGQTHGYVKKTKSDSTARGYSPSLTWVRMSCHKIRSGTHVIEIQISKEKTQCMLLHLLKFDKTMTAFH